MHNSDTGYKQYEALMHSAICQNYSSKQNYALQTPLCLTVNYDLANIKLNVELGHQPGKHNTVYLHINLFIHLHIYFVPFTPVLPDNQSQ